MRGFRRNDLLTYASAISFQVLSALVPFLLFAVGLLGYLDLAEVWSRDLAPELKADLSSASFRLIDDTVRQVLASKQLFWVTAGAAVALWEISGAVRAVMGALDGVYGDRREPPLRETLARSLLLAAVVAFLLLAAGALARFGGSLLGDPQGVAGVLWLVARLALAGLLLALAVGLLVRFGPDDEQPLPWVSLGSGLVVGGWLLMGAGFSVYLTKIADYTSIFGHLATVFVLMTFLYLGAIVFLGGAQLDALLRERAGADDP